MTFCASLNRFFLFYVSMWASEMVHCNFCICVSHKTAFISYCFLTFESTPQAETVALLVGYLSVCASILTVLHGAHRGCVWPRSQVKAQAHQPWSRQMTLQLCYQVLLLLQLITLRQKSTSNQISNISLKATKVLKIMSWGFILCSQGGSYYSSAWLTLL